MVAISPEGKDQLLFRLQVQAENRDQMDVETLQAEIVRLSIDLRDAIASGLVLVPQVEIVDSVERTERGKVVRFVDRRTSY